MDKKNANNEDEFFDELSEESNAETFTEEDLPESEVFGEFEDDEETDKFISEFDEEVEVTAKPEKTKKDKKDKKPKTGDEGESFRKPKKLLDKKMLIILGSIAGVLLIGLGIFSAVKFWGGTVDERAMLYFSSNVLCEDGTNVVAYENINFDIRNYADDLRVSKEEIEDFDIEIYCDSQKITGECTVETGEKAMQADVKSNCNVLISLPEKYSNKDIEIVAISKPIKKEIKATFKYITSWGSTVDDKENNACAILSLTANSNVVLEVTWDPNLVIPETTNQYVKAATVNSNKCTVKLNNGEATQIAFFKKDVTKNYSNDSKAISVSVSGVK